MSAIATITVPTHAELRSQIRGMPTRAKQVHRNRWYEAKNGQRKHRGEWA